MTTPNFKLTSQQAAYLAGIIDGDASIIVQILPKEQFITLFWFQFTVTILQKTSRKHYLIQLQNLIGKDKAFLRDRKDGISELAVFGRHNVKWFLSEIFPYLIMKKTQAKLTFQIFEQLHLAKESPSHFFTLCLIADQIANLNDSKKRKYTADYVKQRYQELNVLQNTIESP